MGEHFGYAGSILLIDLEAESYEVIDTEPYLPWVGGHGMASALFWDYCEDKTVDAFDPKNVVVIASNPFSGTLVPSAAARVDITGIGPFSYPEWYTRSSMGGRIGGLMKASSFDAAVIKGKATHPVWVEVVNGAVSFHDASDLWGKDTWETQQVVWERASRGAPVGEWYELGAGRDDGRTTSRPAVLAIGPAGEHLARVATVTHDAGHVTGQTGFGGVFGAKNLKAISFIGSKSIPIADPGRLVDLRIELQDKYGYHVDDPTVEMPDPTVPFYGDLTRHPGFGGTAWNARDTTARPEGCQGCYRNCRYLFNDGVGNEAICSAALYYTASGKLEDQLKCNTLLNRLGINGFETGLVVYLRNLYKMGVMGKGKQIDTDLPFERFTSYEFVETLLNRMAYREEIGDDLAEGTMRAAMKWGRWDEDSATGLLAYPNWGYPEHYDPRVEVEWSYGSIFSERDINEHGINWNAHWAPFCQLVFKEEPFLSAEQLATELAEAVGLDDPFCYDYSAEGVYSDAKLRAVSWHRHYGRFWIQSMGMCDWAWPNLVNYVNFRTDDHKGATPDYEVAFFQAVTGQDLSYEQSLELGRKMLMLDRAIWVLQGRERDDEQLAEYVFKVPTTAFYPLPVCEDGTWSFSPCIGRTLDHDRFEDVKTRFYGLEGWDDRGYPKRSELASMGLDEVAAALEAVGKIGE